MKTNHPLMNQSSLKTPLGPFSLLETVEYPNGGFTFFYGKDDIAILIDQDICARGSNKTMIAYRSITNKQNEYMARYRKVYRLLSEDLSKIDELLTDIQTENQTEETSTRQEDRADQADASPLEMKFEDLFTNVYGKDSTKYLWKEYGITDDAGHTKFLDYYVRTKNGKGDLAVEENGINYHHPQIIGLQRYREQLNKQNLCTNRNIKLFRFSTEDCQFEERIEDDIKSYLGANTSEFLDRGILVDRSVSCVLYEHQQATLDVMQQQRSEGVGSFLIVFPTASGKSKIVEEDIQAFCHNRENAKILILGPNRDIKRDWQNRVESSLSAQKEQIEIQSYAYMERHYAEYAQDYFDYIVVDEAHHAVAPGLKRTIQYFQPEFWWA